MRIPQNYVPQHLSKKSKGKAIRELKKSRRAYKNRKYHTRKKIAGFKSRKTSWASKATALYDLDKNKPINILELSKKTKCKMWALDKILQKGQGAYYSAGSRPNQTAHSWGNARLYSAVSGGPAAKVDATILLEGCKPTSKALQLSKNAKIPNKKTVKIGGGKPNMKGRIFNYKRARMIIKNIP
jgi:hypothetical protein